MKIFNIFKKKKPEPKTYIQRDVFNFVRLSGLSLKYSTIEEVPEYRFCVYNKNFENNVWVRGEDDCYYINGYDNYFITNTKVVIKKEDLEYLKERVEGC